MLRNYLHIFGWSTLLCGLIFSPRLWAQGGPGESSFIDESGVTTLTDRPEYYRAEGGYLEVELDIQPITIVKYYSFTRSGRIETNDDYKALIRHYANRYKLDKYLVQAVIKAESNFDRYAVSKAGAQGLMQLMPGTSAEMSISDPFDPGQNIAGGTQYLFRLLKLFDNNLDLTLAAYNAGPGNVKKYKGVPPFPETRNYIIKVKRYMRDYSGGRSMISINHTTRRKVQVFKPTNSLPFVVHFKNGTTQPVQQVTEKGNYYILKYKTRHDIVRKIHVAKIEPMT